MNTYLNGIYKFLKALVVLCSVVIMAVSFATIAYAEGSLELNPQRDDGKGYRAYTEFDAKESSGIPRKTILQVYAKQGETIYMASSEYNACAEGGKKGVDIKLTNPTGIVETYDVIKNGKGHIATREQELNGPAVGVNKDNPNCYEPFSYTAKTEGIFYVEFHAYENISVGNDPKSSELKYEKEINSGSNARATVGAWDISVYDGDAYKKGRVFTRYIALNVGQNIKFIYPKVYVLTHDGYEYEVDFNGMDPWGFILYSNNRGLVDFTNRRTLYKNALFKDNNQIASKVYGNVMAPNPYLDDEGKNLTHRIFFNEPADDLPPSIPTTPQVAATFTKPIITSNVKETPHGTSYSEGITVKTDFSKVCTYTMIIDTDGNEKYDPGTDAIIRDAAAKGTNYIIWDGRNDNGEIVKTPNIQVILYVKSGEAHFPFIDVESNPYGIKVKLVNGDDNDVLSDKNPWTVYYDNRSYTTSNGTFVKDKSDTTEALNIVPGAITSYVADKDGQYGWRAVDCAIDDGYRPSATIYVYDENAQASQYVTGAVISEQGAGRYGNTNNNYRYGDEKIIDYWTYSRGFQGSKRRQPAIDMEGEPQANDAIIESDYVNDYVFYKTAYDITNEYSDIIYGYLHGLCFFDHVNSEGKLGTREQNDLPMPVNNEVYVRYGLDAENVDWSDWAKTNTKISDGFFDSIMPLSETDDTRYEAYMLYNDDLLKITNLGDHTTGTLQYNLADAYITVTETAVTDENGAEKTVYTVTEAAKGDAGAIHVVKITGKFNKNNPHEVYTEIGFTMINFPNAEVKITVNRNEYLLDSEDNVITYEVSVTNLSDTDMGKIVVNSHIPINHIIEYKGTDVEQSNSWITYDDLHDKETHTDRYGNVITDVYYPALGKWEISRLHAGATRTIWVKAIANDAGDYTVTADLTAYNEYDQNIKENNSAYDLSATNNHSEAQYSIYKPLFGFTEAKITDVDQEVLAIGQFLPEVEGAAAEILERYNVHSLGFACSFNLTDLDVSVHDFVAGALLQEFQELYKQVYDTENANPEVDKLVDFKFKSAEDDPNDKYFGAAQIKLKNQDGTAVDLYEIAPDAPLYIQGFTLYNQSGSNNPSQYYIREQDIYKIYYDTITNTLKSEIAVDYDAPAAQGEEETAEPAPTEDTGSAQEQTSAESAGSVQG